jgi:tRNA(Ile)-lysidine synthase
MSERGESVPELLARVVESTSRYSMFAPGDRVGVAVSGGADSVCLLHLLIDLSRDWNLHLEVLHLDHGLRGEESFADAAFVRDLAASYNLPCHIKKVDLPAVPGNLEENARIARSTFFDEIRQSRHLRVVATGHTRSDQAETVLFRLLRGTGSCGLTGIRRVTDHGIVRPMLDIYRHEVEAWLRQRSIPWREDRTNTDPAFSRNRIRHRLLPQLAHDWNPQLIENLANLASLAQEDEDYWRQAVEAPYTEAVAGLPPILRIRTQSLNALPEALARRVIRRALAAVRGDLLNIDFRHIEAVLQLAAQTDGHGRLQVPGVDIMRSFEWLRLAPLSSGGPPRDYEYPLTVPGTYAIPEMTVNVGVVKTQSANCGYNEKETYLDWDCLTGPVLLRNWRPGDQYQPTGCKGAQKIKSLFQESRIPLWERRHWPVISAGGQIVWARRFGAAQHCTVNSASVNILRIEVIPQLS